MASTATSRAFLVTAIALAGVMGCQRSEEGDFRAYRDLEPSPKVESTESQVTSDARIAPGETPATSSSTVAREPAIAPQPDPIEVATVSAEVPAPDPSAAPAQKRFGAGQLETAATSGAPREIKVLVPEKQFRNEGRGSDRAVRVSYDDIDLLKILNMDPVTLDAPAHMPDWLKALDGQKIRIRGFMYPPYAETGLEEFNVARDNQICCFGKNFKVYDVFPVIMRKGVTVDYILNRPFDVVGVFRIKPQELNGEVVQIYQIDDAVVIEK